MEEFEKLLSANMRALERFVRFRIGDKHDAEDVLQDICVAAFNGFDCLSDKSAFKPWLMGIARNKCRDYFRIKARSLEIPIDDLNESVFAYGVRGVTVSSVVRETLELLGDKEKQILYLYYFRDLPQDEIANKLGLPLGTVKSRLHYARQKFKEKYPYKERKEIMKRELPKYMPEYTIEKSEKPPFEAICSELPGWLIVPRSGEHVVFGDYEAPSGKLLDVHELKTEFEAEIHGVRGVKISCVIKGVEPSELCSNDDLSERRMDLYAQLTDTRCRFLAQGQLSDGVYQLHTFLDGDGFSDDWGFGEDNCGRETHLAEKGVIVRDGDAITCKEGPYPVEDVVGRYTVRICEKTYDTIRLVCVGPFNSKTLSEQYIDQNGRTVLWRRFNRCDWGFERYGKPWTELLPENERLTVNGETFVHWYDSITDNIL